MPYNRPDSVRKDPRKFGDSNDNIDISNHYYGWGSNPLTPSRLEDSQYGDNSSQEELTARYAGRGPKSYRRSDDRIRDDVCDLLMDHDEIDATEIDVDVNDGVVTLSGTVPQRRMRLMAEDIASYPFGVKDVSNEIRVMKLQS